MIKGKREHVVITGIGRSKIGHVAQKWHVFKDHLYGRRTSIPSGYEAGKIERTRKRLGTHVSLTVPLVTRGYKTLGIDKV